jgi:FlgN protein
VTLATALTVAETLRDELEAEVGRSRDERLVLRSLDGLRIQARMSERLSFIETAERLQERLRSAQAQAARELGLTDPSADSIARVRPREGARLVEVLAQIRALASTLSELSALNQSLAERALTCTRAYVKALSPRPSAYGRFGAVPPPGAFAPRQSAVSRRA